MLPIHVALVAEESKITTGELVEVAAALQKQVTRDFAPIWGVVCDVTTFPALEKMPLDYWPIIVRDDIAIDAEGVHEDAQGQPFALVKYDDSWPLMASHEALEMLADPFGRRLVAGDSVVENQGRVLYLVEVCDPCEAGSFAYSINGVTVSDFYTPNFFDPVTAAGVRYSFNNSLTQPRQVAKGGYLTWFVPATGQWWQRTWFGAGPIDGPIAKFETRNGNLRTSIDRTTAKYRKRAMSTARSIAGARETGGMGGEAPAFRKRAAALRAAIREVLGVREILGVR
jgi:hypothetical protein